MLLNKKKRFALLVGAVLSAVALATTASFADDIVVTKAAPPAALPTDPGACTSAWGF